MGALDNPRTAARAWISAYVGTLVSAGGRAALARLAPVTRDGLAQDAADAQDVRGWRRLKTLPAWTLRYDGGDTARLSWADGGDPEALPVPRDPDPGAAAWDPDEP